MEIKTKFNFGETVHQIWFTQKQTWVPCGFCDGIGKIEGKNGKSSMCPECYARCGSYIKEKEKWVYQQKLTVGEIRVEKRCAFIPDQDTVFDNYGIQTASTEEKYMCYETGIGSGTLWPVEKLFHTEEEAQAECDRLNKD